MLKRQNRRRTVRAAIDSLESRRLLNGAYFALSSTNAFSENWTDTSRITANDNWDNVPSIIGYRGDDLTTATNGTDPQTLTQNDALAVVDVIANQVNPNTVTAGGVAEFEIANPTIALNGSGTADAPYIQLFINASAVTPTETITVSYKLRDLDGSGDNSVQQVALHYRVGTSGNWTNVAAAYVADATDGPNTAGRETDVSVELPSTVNGSAELQLRIMTTNANGNDEWVGVDDISVTAATVAGPGSFSFNPSTYAVNEADGTVSLSVLRSGGSSGAVDISYSTVDGTAVGGSDFTSVSNGTLNFVDGQLSGTITINILNDSVAETLENFSVTLNSATAGATIGGTSTAAISIADNDATAPTSLLLNEILVNPVGTDQPNEYIELRGTPNETLFGVYVLSIEGEGAAAGTVDVVFDLSSATVGSNGLLVIKSPSSQLTFDPATGVVNETRFNPASLLENGSNSFLLVFSGNSVPGINFDIDTNNDGTIDGLPGGATLIDGVGYISSGTSATDRAYGAALPEGTGTPDAVTRLLSNTTPLSVDAWVYGDLAGPTNIDLAYSTTISPNAPAGAALTPGAANFDVESSDTTPPTLDSSAFNFLAVSRQNVTLVFSEDVGASVGAGDFTLTNLSTSSTVGVSVASVSGDGKTVVLEFVSTGNSLGSTILADGNYRLTVAGGSILDTAGNALAADANVNFAFKNADFNGDLSVGFLDLVELSRNYGVPSGATFARGDANYDGAVNFADLVALSRLYGTGLPFARANVIGQTGSSTTTSAARATSLVSSATPRSTGRGVFGSETRIV